MGIYFELPYVERVPKKNGSYYYYLRKARKEPRLRLPDVATGEKACKQAHADKLLILEKLKEEKACIQEFLTVTSLLKRYFKNKSPRWSKQTKKLYKEHMVALIDKFGDMQITELTKKEVQRFRDSFEFASTANEKLKFLKAAFNWAQEEDLLGTNQLHSIKRRPTGGVGRVAWLPQDIKRFRAVHPEGSWARLAFEILLAVGCRISDLILLTRDNIRKYVQYDSIQYVSVKTKTPSFICIPDHLKKLLHRVYRDGGHLLLNPHTNKPFTSTGSFSYHFKKAREAAGITKTAHGLRKSASISYAEGNASAVSLKAMFGWKDIRTAEGYVKQASTRETGLAESARQIANAEHALRISGALYF